MENPLLDRFPGVIGFPVSPFSDAGEFDAAAFRENVTFMLDTRLAALAFCGSNGVTRGTDNLLQRYRTKYPTAKERGVLTFTVLELRPLGADTALVIGKYELAREEPASGFFSLIVKRTPDGLRILHDHTTASEEGK